MPKVVFPTPVGAMRAKLSPSNTRRAQTSEATKGQNRDAGGKIPQTPSRSREGNKPTCSFANFPSLGAVRTKVVADSALPSRRLQREGILNTLTLPLTGQRLCAHHSWGTGVERLQRAFLFPPSLSRGSLLNDGGNRSILKASVRCSRKL